jgi:hypothetical protein
MHMQQNLTDVDFLFSSEEKLLNARNVDPEEIFSDAAIDFFSALSAELYKMGEIRAYPDLATVAFYCRKSNLQFLKKKYEDGTVRLGRGVIFHVAPSNVPLNFAYSMISGFLSGNANIVRLPSKDFPQVNLLCDAIKKVSSEQRFSFIADRLFLIKYDRNSKATGVISALCDVRVIWGGDASIEQIRKNPIPSRSFDVTFADRYSFAVINADALVNETNLSKLADQFFNDTYLFDQNACSAPRLMVWTGEDKNLVKAKEMFWSAVEERIKNYSLSPILAVDKLTSLFLQSVSGESVVKLEGTDNKLWRVSVDKLTSDIDRYTCAGGYFIEHDAKTLDELKIIVNRRYQTLAYYGFEREFLVSFVKRMKFAGIDRVVPIGQTTDFNLIWDGYDLIRSLSRECLVV